MDRVIVAKFGGSTIGQDGNQIPTVIERIKDMRKEGKKIVAVFSAPIMEHEGKVKSMTDIAISIGRKYASGQKLDSSIFYDTYLNIAKKYMSQNYLNEFEYHLQKFYSYVTISLNHAAENKRFIDVTRSRILAYSGEITMSYLMDYIMRSNGLKSNHVDIDKWPIITDDNFEAANFMYDESKEHKKHFLQLLEQNEVISIGGFIGKTIDGLETTYERGGSDRTAADIAIILYDEFKTQIDFEKDNIVLSADPKIIKEGLEYIRYLSYNEARLAGMFGMKILDPIAIKEIDDNNLDIPIVITSILNPSEITIIEKTLVNRNKDFSDDNKGNDNSLIKIVTGKRNCVIVRMESIAASYLIASLEKDKQYHNFLKLSPYNVDDIEITRLLFLDADYVKRHERHFKAFYPKVEFAYGKGVVTLIGDMMWKMPNIVSTASRTVGDYDINILNLDAQEETSRILIIVDDLDNNVANAIKAIHLQREIRSV
ncbi:MAG TPA: aspartate kinase [Nitrososphaeraceae archaeon]|jgi:aspartate kinase|nr:aspartate kinase [Nitrososphaeraceae archaeon]HET8792154.1 aspartate kinase [Nitrososphaeraceae archaeon]